MMHLTLVHVAICEDDYNKGWVGGVGGGSGWREGVVGEVGKEKGGGWKEWLREDVGGGGG